jgi:uncharacterized protein (DUF2384 family)
MGAVIEQLYDERGRVDMAAVADMIGESIARVAQMTPLTAGALRKNPTSDRAQPAGRRFVRVLSDLTWLLGNRKAALIWLRTPNRELEDHSPLDLLYGRHFEAVEGLVADLRSGSPG